MTKIGLRGGGCPTSDAAKHMAKPGFAAPSLLEMKRVTTHPGEMLDEEYLKPFGISARGLAAKIGVPANRLTEIIAKRRGVTADTAIRLALFLHTTPEFWMNMQSMYDLTSAVLAKRKAYAAIGALDNA